MVAAMLTAHIPSGYCLARLVSRPVPLLMPAALVGAVFPDFDLLFFYFVDNRAIHHHRYWVHVPAFWAVVAALATPVLTRLGYGRTGAVSFGAIVTHLVLDSLNGGIMWLYPFDETLYRLITVPVAHSHWVLSYALHWSFALELAIWAVAGAMYLRRPHGGGIRAWVFRSFEQIRRPLQ